MKNNPAKKNRTQESVFIFTIVLLSFFLWNTIFIYPIKLFVVFLHESSHAIAILLTGGRIAEISLGFNLGGKIIAEGGNDMAIASSGYLGSLIFGLLIFISSELQKVRRYIFLALAFLFLAITLISSPSLEFILIGIITIGILVFFAFFVRILLVKLIAKSFALVSSIYIIIDIKEDMLNDVFSSDAHILAGLLGMDQIIISFLWLVISIILIWITVRLSFQKGNSKHL